MELGDGKKSRPMYVSSLLEEDLKQDIIALLKEYKDCFEWSYEEMPGLSQDVVEHRLPLKPGKKPIK